MSRAEEDSDGSNVLDASGVGRDYGEWEQDIKSDGGESDREDSAAAAAAPVAAAPAAAAAAPAAAAAEEEGPLSTRRPKRKKMASETTGDEGARNQESAEEAKCDLGPLAVQANVPDQSDFKPYPPGTAEGTKKRVTSVVHVAPLTLKVARALKKITSRGKSEIPTTSEGLSGWYHAYFRANNIGERSSSSCVFVFLPSDPERNLDTGRGPRGRYYDGSENAKARADLLYEFVRDGGMFVAPNRTFLELKSAS